MQAWRRLRKAEYEQYLQSSHWATLKARKARTSPPKCGSCWRTHGLHLHHLVYHKDFKATTPSELMWLCKWCHEVAHRLVESGHLKFTTGKHSPAVMAVMTKAAIRRANESDLEAFRQAVGATGEAAPSVPA